jgi:hypothetical protein
MSLIQKPYLVYAYAPASTDGYRGYVKYFDDLSKAVEQAHCWAQDQPNATDDLVLGEKRYVAIYQLAKVIKHESNP